MPPKKAQADRGTQPKSKRGGLKGGDRSLIKTKVSTTVTTSTPKSAPNLKRPHSDSTSPLQDNSVESSPYSLTQETKRSNIHISPTKNEDADSLSDLISSFSGEDPHDSLPHEDDEKGDTSATKKEYSSSEIMDVLKTLSSKADVKSIEKKLKENHTQLRKEITGAVNKLKEDTIKETARLDKKIDSKHTTIRQEIKQDRTLTKKQNDETKEEMNKQLKLQKSIIDKLTKKQAELEESQAQHSNKLSEIKQDQTDLKTELNDKNYTGAVKETLPFTRHTSTHMTRTAFVTGVPHNIDPHQWLNETCTALQIVLQKDDILLTYS